MVNNIAKFILRTIIVFFIIFILNVFQKENKENIGILIFYSILFGVSAAICDYVAINLSKKTTGFAYQVSLVICSSLLYWLSVDFKAYMLSTAIIAGILFAVSINIIDYFMKSFIKSSFLNKGSSNQVNIEITAKKDSKKIIPLTRNSGNRYSTYSEDELKFALKSATTTQQKVDIKSELKKRNLI